MQTSASECVVLVQRHYRKMHEIISDGSSRADCWAEFCEPSMRIFFDVTKSKQLHFGRNNHTRVLGFSPLGVRHGGSLDLSCCLLYITCMPPSMFILGLSMSTPAAASFLFFEALGGAQTSLCQHQHHSHSYPID